MPGVDTIHLVDDADLAVIADLAMSIPIRTVQQQESLLRICGQLDNAFVSWTATALTTWEGRRCTCGRAIPVTVDNCSACTRERVLS